MTSGVSPRARLWGIQFSGGRVRLLHFPWPRLPAGRPGASMHGYSGGQNGRWL